MSGGLFALVALVILAVGASPVAAEPARHAGRLHSLLPANGRLVIEEVGVNGKAELVEIEISDARAVRVWRDAEQPWLWREQPIRLHTLPAGTFVVIIGRDLDDHVLASRIEVPADRRP